MLELALRGVELEDLAVWVEDSDTSLATPHLVWNCGI
jgi:hypothetical protein